MYMPDSMDKQIVQLLGKDARQNSKTLAKKLNLSSATVRRRLRKLLKNELIHIIGVVDPAKFDLPLAALLALNVAADKLESAVETLDKHPQIRWVSITTGRFDIIALGRFASTDRLSEFMIKELPQMDGLKNIETFICLDVKRGRYIPLTPS